MSAITAFSAHHSFYYRCLLICKANKIVAFPVRFTLASIRDLLSLSRHMPLSQLSWAHMERESISSDALTPTNPIWNVQNTGNANLYFISWICFISTLRNVFNLPSPGSKQSIRIIIPIRQGPRTTSMLMTSPGALIVNVCCRREPEHEPERWKIATAATGAVIFALVWVHRREIFN